MIRCPYCRYESDEKGFNLIKTWRYRWWNVYFYQCPRCGSRFRYQVDPSGKYKTFVMRVGKR